MKIKVCLNQGWQTQSAPLATLALMR